MNKSSTTDVIARLQSEIVEMDDKSVNLKRTVNTLCDIEGIPHLYNIEDTSKSILNIRSDQFYGEPLAAAVAEILRLRGDSKSGGLGAAAISEIFDLLRKGGFVFENKNDSLARRNTAITLSKNSAKFVKVPSSSDESVFGLREWYDDPKPRKTTQNSSHETTNQTDGGIEQGEEHTEVPTNALPDHTPVIAIPHEHDSNNGEGEYADDH